MTGGPGVAAASVTDLPWTGQWVSDRLDLELTGHSGSGAPGVQDLVGLALRRNPRRAHLIVSRVLGKHVPVSPSVVLSTGRELGQMVLDVLAGEPAGVVVGFAETATALGHCVAATVHAPYIHTTRRDVPVPAGPGSFEEVHSHAPTHRLLAADPGLLAAEGPLVLVDDEISTGTTSLNLITRLHEFCPRDRYVLAALVDVRSTADRERLQQWARDLGIRLDVVALTTGEVRLGDDVLSAGAALVESHGAATVDTVPGERGEVRRVSVGWPHDVPEGGRHGFGPEAEQGFAAAVGRLVDAIGLDAHASRVHVLGHEELMYLPVRLAAELERRATDRVVTVSSTTRSPVLAIDDPAYAVRDALVFPAHDGPTDGPGPRYAYNLRSLPRPDAIVLVVDDVADARLTEPGGLVDQVSRIAAVVHLVVVPAFRPVVP